MKNNRQQHKSVQKIELKAFDFIHEKQLVCTQIELKAFDFIHIELLCTQYLQ